MMNTNRLAIRAALALTVLAAAASPARAQDTTSDAEKAPVKIGPLELWPTLDFRNIGIDGNVFNEAENPKRDFIATVVPMLELVVRPPRTRISYSTASEFAYFQDYTDERHVNRRFTARAEFDLTYVQPYATIGAAQSRERPNSEIDLRARNRARSYSAGFRAPLGPVASVTLGVRRQTSRYQPGEEFRGADLAAELNSETNAIEGTLGLALTPLTTVGVAVSREEDRFDRSPLRNSDSLRVAPTIAFKPFGLFSGSATVGWRRFDAVDPSVADYSGLTAGGAIGLVIVDRYHIETTFGRDIRYSYEPDTPTYVWTSGRGTLRMDLFGGVDVKIVGAREVMAYRARLDAGDAAPRDTLVMYSAGLGYNIRERIRIGVDAEFMKRRSALASRGYQSNRVFASLAWGVRPQ